MESKNDDDDIKIDTAKCKSTQDQQVDIPVRDIEAGWKFWKKRRYVVCMLALFGFFSSNILRVNLSIAIVAMTTKTSAGAPEFDWSSKLQGHILSAFFYGYVSTQLFGGWLSSRVGGKRIFGLGIGITALTTLITPLIVRLNVYLFIALRVLEGLCEGVTVPCIHAIWSKWAPPLERSKLATIAISGNSIGTVFAMPTCGFIAEKYGWSTIFYVYGVIALIAISLWWYFVTDKPEDDPRISTSELRYIQHSLGQNQSKTVSHPWKSIFTSPAVLAIAAAHFCENWGFYTMLTQLPKFMNDVLNFKLEKTGFFSALPYLTVAIVLQISGRLADYLRSKKILNTTQVRKLFTCAAFVNQTIFMILAAFVGTSTGAVTCLIIAVGFGGFAVSGFYVNHLDLAPQHASVLIGITNTVAALPGVLSPIAAGYIVQNKTAEEWKTVFIIAGSIYFGGAVAYATLASGERQKWAQEVKTTDGFNNPALDISSTHI